MKILGISIKTNVSPCSISIKEKVDCESFRRDVPDPVFRQLTQIMDEMLFGETVRPARNQK